MSLVVMTRDVVRGAGVGALADIRHHDVALALWERDLPPGLRDALPRLDLDALDDVAVTLAADEAPDLALRTAGYPEAAIAPLAADIAMLLRRHAALTGTGRLSLRLEVVETDACRRFHADYVTLRLLCTYAGPGTQWHSVTEADTIRQVPTGAVAVFKGRLLLDPPTLLHRSPPIAATGQRRLMLAIDPVSGTRG